MLPPNWLDQGLFTLCAMIFSIMFMGFMVVLSNHHSLASLKRNVPRAVHFNVTSKAVMRNVIITFTIRKFVTLETLELNRTKLTLWLPMDTSLNCPATNFTSRTHQRWTSKDCYQLVRELVLQLQQPLMSQVQVFLRHLVCHRLHPVQFLANMSLIEAWPVDDWGSAYLPFR